MTGKQKGSFSSTKSLFPKDVKYPIAFQHLGRHGYELILYAPTYIARKKWLEYIAKQRKVLLDKADIYTWKVICGKVFTTLGNRVHCVAPLDGGRKLVYGTNKGIYLSELKDGQAKRPPELKIVMQAPVRQLDVVEEFGVLLGLSDKTLYSWPLDALENNMVAIGSTEKVPEIKTASGRKVGNGGINFYRVGLCLGRILVVTVKTSSSAAVIKVMEFNTGTGGSLTSSITNQSNGGSSGMPGGKTKKNQPSLRKFLSGNSSSSNTDQQHQYQLLKVFKEFTLYMDVKSVSFLTNKLCIGGSKGFEIVNLDTGRLEIQSLLDSTDSSLDFVLNYYNSGSNGISSSNSLGLGSSTSSVSLSNMDSQSSNSSNSLQPLAIYRLHDSQEDILLNYSDFSFFITKNGQRSKNHNWRIDWEGRPQAFALSYPYLLGFDHEFIEIRDLSNRGKLACTITRPNSIPSTSTCNAYTGLGISTMQEPLGTGTGADGSAGGKKIRFLYENMREIVYVCEDEEGYERIVALDFWGKKKQQQQQNR